MGAGRELGLVWRDIALNSFVASVVVPAPMRWRLLRFFGLKVERSRIMPHVFIGDRNVSIGVGTFVNYRCVFNSGGGGIVIGRNCNIAMDVKFITSTHEIGGPDRRAGRPSGEPIRVGDGVWLGVAAILLPGVAVGSGAIVAAGAVVTHDVEPNSIYAGVPARKVRDL